LNKITAKNGKFMIYNINKEIAATYVKIKNTVLFSMTEIQKMKDYLKSKINNL
jgi:hypothetical protein